MTANFEVVRLKRDGRGIIVYLCPLCTRGWQLPEPCEPWRLKALISHVEAHDAVVSRALSHAAEALQTPSTEKAVTEQITVEEVFKIYTGEPQLCVSLVNRALADYTVMQWNWSIVDGKLRLSALMIANTKIGQAVIAQGVAPNMGVRR